MVAGEGVVGDDDVDAATVAIVLVAAGAPVLPESDLPTRAFLPHGARVVETPRPLSVAFKCKVFLWFCWTKAEFRNWNLNQVVLTYGDYFLQSRNASRAQQRSLPSKKIPEYKDSSLPRLQSRRICPRFQGRREEFYQNSVNQII